MIWDENLKKVATLNSSELSEVAILLKSAGDGVFENGNILAKFLGKNNKNDKLKERYHRLQNTIVLYYGILLQDICDCPEWHIQANKKFGKTKSKKDRVISSLCEVMDNLWDEEFIKKMEK